MPQESSSRTVDALDRLDESGFPTDRFPQLHQWARSGKTAPPSAAAHRADAEGKSFARGQNVQTRRRIDRAAKLFRESGDADAAIRGAWKAFPLWQQG